MKFSDIAEAYNLNAQNLDEARTRFEEEVRNFIQMISQVTNREIKRLNADASLKERRHWHAAETNSSKAALPLGFYSESVQNLAIRPPGAKNFKNKAAIISFQISFDDSLGQFCFKGIFTNTNEVNEYFDEKFADLCREKIGSLPDVFKDNAVNRTREYIAFKAPLNGDLLRNVESLVKTFYELCDLTILNSLQEPKADQESA